MIPEPTPVATPPPPNGEKLSTWMPSAVIVTTECFAWATMSVRSAAWTVVGPVAVVEPVVGEVETGAAAGSICETTSALPPDARTADRTAAARTVGVPTRFRSSVVGFAGAGVVEGVGVVAGAHMGAGPVGAEAGWLGTVVVDAAVDA